MGVGRVGGRPLTDIGRSALFLDRDGVLNEPVWDEHVGRVESPLAVSDVVLTRDAGSALRRVNEAGILTVVVSNQPSAAKGFVDAETIRAIHRRVLELLGEQGATVDHSYLCLHHPDGTVEGLTSMCDCRKPAPGLLLAAAADLDLDLSRCWSIGDTDADVGAACAAGLAGVVIVENPRSAHRRTEISRRADAYAPTFSAAVDIVLDLIDGT